MIALSLLMLGSALTTSLLGRRLVRAERAAMAKALQRAYASGWAAGEAHALHVLDGAGMLPRAATIHYLVAAALSADGRESPVTIVSRGGCA